MLDKDTVKKIKHIEIVTRKAVENYIQGAYKSSFKGQGLQFKDIREYQHGDDIRHIAWKLTAKTPEQAFVKVFDEERSLNVSILADLSASNRFGLYSKKKLDLIAELTSLLSFSALRTNDFLSFMSFSSDIDTHIPHKKGKKHVMRIIAEVFQKTVLGGKTDLKTVFASVRSLLKKRGIVFIISDFISDANYLQELRLLSRKHDVVAFWIYDPAEYEFPKLGLMDFRDAETGKTLLVDTSSLEFSSKQRKLKDAYLRRTKQILASSGVDFVKISTQDDYVKVIELFFKRRSKLHARL